MWLWFQLSYIQSSQNTWVWFLILMFLAALVTTPKAMDVAKWIELGCRLCGFELVLNSTSASQGFATSIAFLWFGYGRERLFPKSLNGDFTLLLCTMSGCGSRFHLLPQQSCSAWLHLKLQVHLFLPCLHPLPLPTWECTTSENASSLHSVLI